MIWALRAAFALVLAMLGSQLLRTWWEAKVPEEAAPWWWGSLAGLLFGGIFILIEVAFTRRFLAIISVVMFGVVFGFIASFLFSQTLFLLPVFSESTQSNPWFRDWVQYCSLAVFVYLSVIGILQSKDDFKFVIPFVDLKTEHKGPKPILLDTSVIIDGRIAEVVDMNLISSKVILPRFVLQELQTVADSQDKLKRNRGRRGLDILNRMQRSKGAVIEIYEGAPPGLEGVDAKLVALAKHLDARIVTNDFNLNKVAQLQGVEVVNLNDLAVAMRPVILPGEGMEVKIQKPGEGHGQGVGYLDDGTMVVVEGGYHRIGEVVPITVTSAIQTSAGRMIFGAIRGTTGAPQTPGAPVPDPPRHDSRSAKSKSDRFRRSDLVADDRGRGAGGRRVSDAPGSKPKTDVLRVNPGAHARPTSDQFRSAPAESAQGGPFSLEKGPQGLPMPADSSSFRSSDLQPGPELSLRGAPSRKGSDAPGLRKGSDAPAAGTQESDAPAAGAKARGPGGELKA
jgi:uncharacterized protein YacL